MVLDDTTNDVYYTSFKSNCAFPCHNRSIMRTQFGLAVLAVSVASTAGFLPSIGIKQAKGVASTRRAQPLFSLGGGDYDLLKGSKASGAPKDEFDLLGSKAQQDVPIIQEVSLAIQSTLRSPSHSSQVQHDYLYLRMQYNVHFSSTIVMSMPYRP